MKTTCRRLLCSAILLLAILAASKPAAAASADTTVVDRRVIATYFHTTARCASCLKIETYTHDAIATAFPHELESGHLVWRLVNLDPEENRHFVQDYQLYTKSVIVAVEENGKQVRWKNLEKIWTLLPNQKKFQAYVQDEIRRDLAPPP